jgi:hypothetical protein
MPSAGLHGRFLILEEDRLAWERIQQSGGHGPCRRSSQVSCGPDTHFERGRASDLFKDEVGRLTSVVLAESLREGTSRRQPASATATACSTQRETPIIERDERSCRCAVDFGDHETGSDGGMEPDGTSTTSPHATCRQAIRLAIRSVRNGLAQLFRSQPPVEPESNAVPVLRRRRTTPRTCRALRPSTGRRRLPDAPGPTAVRA